VYTAVALRLRPTGFAGDPELSTRIGITPYRFDMSLILEALKKSEARRQLGEAPGIGTPFTVTPRRRSVLPLLVVLILVAAGVGWYFLRASPGVDAGKSNAAAEQTIAATPAGPATAAAPGVLPPPAAATGAPNAATAAPNVEPGRGPFDGKQARAALDALRASRAQQQANAAANPTNPAPNAGPGRGPFGGKPGDPALRAMEAARAAQPGSAGEPPGLIQQRLAQAREARARMAGAPGPTPPPAAAADAAASVAPPQPAKAAVATPPAAPAGQAAPTAPAARAAPPVAGSAAAAAPAAPAPAPSPAPGTPKAPGAALASADLPMYYELPFNVRKDLPTLAISMHVYSAAPDQRFVMIDGERKAEGETFKELTLREIRSDGMVLEFRGQRFFYPRSGH